MSRLSFHDIKHLLTDLNISFKPTISKREAYDKLVKETARKLCHCYKEVSKTSKDKSLAAAVCRKSVLHTRDLETGTFVCDKKSSIRAKKDDKQKAYKTLVRKKHTTNKKTKKRRKR